MSDTTETTQQTQQTPAIPWLPNADADTVGYVQNKGWQSPADALTGYRNLEKMMGAERAGRTVVLPAEDTPEAWAPVFEKLGRPVNADGYKLTVPEGQSPEFAKAAAAQFHALGLTSRQGEALAKWWNEQAGSMSQAQAAAEEAALQAETEGLKKDWGNEYEHRTELTRRAVVKLGLEEKDIAAFEKVAGFSKTMKVFAKVADMMKEHGAEGIDAPGSFGMTPEGAKAKKAQLMADPGWRSRAMNPASAEWAELTKLNKIIAGA